MKTEYVRKYGLKFPSALHPLEMEYHCIRKGGKWVANDIECGKGLYFHFREAIRITWPEFAQQRWFDVILEAYLEHEWIGIAGPKNSGKSASLSVIPLTDYYCFPSMTAIILSSTTMEGLDNRIFAEVKMRHRSARRRIEWLPGHLIEGRRRIVTAHQDEFKEGRDFRCGVICIPVRQGDKNAMENIVGIKNKRKRWILDELQTLQSSALDGTANFFEPGADCKAIGMGNPSDITDAHGKLCEPHSSLGGWESKIDQEGKTKTWRTRFDKGICVQLPGSDSPNMDVGPNDPVPFPFLMTRARMESDARTWGKNDWHFQMFNEGRWPRGQASNRVITRQMCINGHALEVAKWAAPSVTKLLCCDAGFGGDRCVCHELHFGFELWQPPQLVQPNGELLIRQQEAPAERRQIIALANTWIIPIEGSDVKTAEDQIVLWLKNKASESNIPANQVFYEAGMRTSLVQKFPQLWSQKPVSIDFGGKPSENMVSSDIQISCREFYFNLVTEYWYTMRLVVECEQFRQLDEATMEEGCMREYKRVAGNKLQVETKAEFKEKTGFSPDRFDALVTGIEGAKRLGFVLRRIKAPEDEEEDSGWKRDLREKSRKFWKAGQLVYT